MKRLITAFLIAGLVAGALSAPAMAGKKKKGRVAEGSYTGSAAGLFGSLSGNNVGGFQFPTGVGEGYVSVVVTDQSGTMISGSVAQDPDGDQLTDEKGTFCGKTDKPVAIQPGVPVVIYVDQGVCNNQPSIVTTGTIKVTFSSKP